MRRAVEQPAARLLSDRQKNAANSAIRKIVNVKFTTFLAIFSQFRAVSAQFLCQEPLFQFDEKTALESCRAGFQKQPSGRESGAGGKREKKPRTPDSDWAQRDPFVSNWGAVREGGASQCKAEERVRLLIWPEHPR
jgi:hypothetical protein